VERRRKALDAVFCPEVPSTGDKKYISKEKMYFFLFPFGETGISIPESLCEGY
jgi:hypothetical protein